MWNTNLLIRETLNLWLNRINSFNETIIVPHNPVIQARKINQSLPNTTQILLKKIPGPKNEIKDTSTDKHFIKHAVGKQE